MIRQKIIEAIELADSIWPQLEGLNEYVPSDTCRANITDDPYHMANRVSCARMSEANATAEINKFIAFYKDHERGFVWSVGPLSTPSNLETLLREHGFEEIGRSDGLYLNGLSKSEVDQAEFRVTEIPIEVNSPTIPTLAKGFDMSLESSRNSHRIFYLASRELRLHTYAAFADGVETPAACAYLTCYPNQPIGLLAGATTLPEYRNRGLYKALLQARINDAVDDSIETLIILADQASSAPICHRFGFKKACESTLYKHVGD